MDKAQEWQNLVIAFKQSFNTKEGQLILKYLSYQCYEHRNTFEDGNEQRNQGKREIILLIREWLSKDPNEIPEHLKEKPNG